MKRDQTTLGVAVRMQLGRQLYQYVIIYYAKAVDPLGTALCLIGGRADDFRSVICSARVGVEHRSEHGHCSEAPHQQ